MEYGNDLPSIGIVDATSCITAVVAASGGIDNQSEMYDLKMDFEV